MKSRGKLSKGKFVLCPPILCLALVSTIIFLLLCFKWGRNLQADLSVYMCILKGKLKPNEFKADILPNRLN